VLDNEEKLGDFLETLDIDKDKFFKVYASEEIGELIKSAYVLGQDYGLTGVPAIIVNGKYRTSASQAGSHEKLIQVIDELIQKEKTDGAIPQTP
jgi:Predicted dithiol-disulfide isomerase involved in polyketide biosynthesis